MTLQKEELTTDTSKLLILGSGSTARKELLISVGLIPDKIEVPDVDESLKLNESPDQYVRRVAKLKANAISCDKRSYLITADTTVTVGRRFLMKTSDEIKAEEYLRLLSGRRHSVLTAYCIKHNDLIISKSVKTVLKMRLLTNKEIRAYIESRDWVGCAGAYSIQGRAQCFFPFISGCYSNVVGLPLPSLMGVLDAMGYFNK
tara:strand:- start:198 stop:803 length:606 start_codon:yes stop_codon:yes gene_type:complete